MEVIAIVVFVVVIGLIISEKVNSAAAALAGAMALVVTGVMSAHKALSYIDFNTIGLLVGMMVLVAIIRQSGLFEYVAIKAAKMVHGDPWKIMIAFILLTAVLSGILDNVTTVLLVGPMTIAIAKMLEINPVPFLMTQILASNVGGTATLIGDPPNIMIGSAVGLDFMAFVENLTLISIIIFILVQFILIGLYHKGLHTQPELQDKIMRLPAGAQITDHTLLRKCLALIALTITLFVLHGSLGLESATVALFGAGLLLLITATRDENMITKVLSKIEWPAIFFFGGLFILVGALVETGVIRMLAAEAIKVTNGNEDATAMLILWMSAIASAFIDNIPFVATLIPLIQDMGRMGLSDLTPMWWSLALGACLGGNGTLIGASANVVVASMAAQRGRPISFLSFMKVAFPVMIFTIIVSSVYVYLRYL